MQRAVILGGLVALVSTSSIAAITAPTPVNVDETELVFKNGATRDVAERLAAAFETPPDAKRVTSLCSEIMAKGPGTGGARAHAQNVHARFSQLKWEIQCRVQELKRENVEGAVSLTTTGADMVSLMETFVTNAHLECAHY